MFDLNRVASQRWNLTTYLTNSLYGSGLAFRVEVFLLTPDELEKMVIFGLNSDYLKNNPKMSILFKNY